MMQMPRVISKETIKPSSPTPTHLRNYDLSLMDQLTPNLYLPMVLFYANMGCDNPSNITNIATRLKQALSQTLTRYYPFAGRLASKVSIDCNDQGVEFYEAQLNCTLSDILKNPEPQIMDIFYPKGLLWNRSYEGSLVVIQVTYFKCGGMAISEGMSHKIANGNTTASFWADWASMARGSSKELPLLYPLQFISVSLEPPKDPPIIDEITEIERSETCVTRRFVFSASKLEELKGMVRGSGVCDRPSRVDVVNAIIYKCLMSASSEAKPRASSGKYVFLQPVNLRPKISSLPMQVTYAGNFAWISQVTVNNENESEKQLHNLVGAIKNGIEQFNDKFANNLSVNECYVIICDAIKYLMNKKVNGDGGEEDGEVINLYKGNSLCRFPFDETNFGWGKPIWAGTFSSGINNTFLLKDGQDFGIEAWVTLEKQEMAISECHDDLLAFATPNPSVVMINHPPSS